MAGRFDGSSRRFRPHLPEKLSDSATNYVWWQSGDNSDNEHPSFRGEIALSYPALVWRSKLCRRALDRSRRAANEAIHSSKLFRHTKWTEREFIGWGTDGIDMNSSSFSIFWFDTDGNQLNTAEKGATGRLSCSVSVVSFLIRIPARKMIQWILSLTTSSKCDRFENVAILTNLVLEILKIPWNLNF